MTGSCTHRRRAAMIALAVGAVIVGCGSGKRAATPPVPSALAAESRPIGQGAVFHPPARGRLVGRCRQQLGQRFGAHVEVFAANRVVLVPAGIGTLPPRSFSAGRISAARCYADLVTLEPTGLVLVRPAARLTLSDLFRSWGQPLSRRQLASFPARPGGGVAVFVGGRPWTAPPGAVPLTRHAEIVLEIGPRVPPHASYTFPPGL
jgi:hypothetical protein